MKKNDEFFRRRALALLAIFKLRREIADEVEFGRKVAPIIDMLIAEEESGGRPEYGAWSDEEKRVLKESFAKFSSNRDAIDDVCSKINRTVSQVRAMAKNIGVYRPYQ
jgi:hypothetical protein